MKHTEATKEKIRTKLKGRKLSMSTIEKMRGRVAWNKGIKTGCRVIVKMTTCKQCKKEFKMSRCSKNIFCSPNCSHQSMRGISKPFTGKCAGGWNKGFKMPQNSGENHFRWIEDRTKLKDDHRDRGGQLHREWSQKVKVRDGGCRIADVNCDGRLEAHHILGWTAYPELRYEVNNGITLCHAHHPRKRIDEAKLSPFFQSLVAEMN